MRKDSYSYRGVLSSKRPVNYPSFRDHGRQETVLWISIGFNANADPDPHPAFKVNADPEPKEKPTALKREHLGRPKHETSSLLSSLWFIFALLIRIQPTKNNADPQH
jgi:hypothetical protein